MAVNAFVLGLTTIRYVAFHPCTVSSIHVCDFFPVYERCSRRGGTPPDRGVGLDGRVVIVRHYRPALSLSLSSSVRHCLGKTGAKGTWTCASTGWKKKRRKERGKKGVEAVCFADVGGSGGGGGGGSCFFFWRGEEWEFVFIVSDGHPRGIIKISVSRRRDILATHVPLAGIASVRRFSSRDRG